MTGVKGLLRSAVNFGPLCIMVCLTARFSSTNGRGPWKDRDQYFSLYANKVTADLVRPCSQTNMALPVAFSEKVEREEEGGA